MKVENAVHRTGASYSDDEAYRFDLWWKWSEGPLLVAWLLNPSTATERVLDKSVLRIMVEADNLGLGGFRILNLSPFRSKTPKFKTTESAAIRETNRRHTERVLDEAADARWRVVAGWGNGGLDRQDEALKMARTAKVDLYRFGPLTAEGAPRHPSRLPEEYELTRWNL